MIAAISGRLGRPLCEGVVLVVTFDSFTKYFRIFTLLSRAGDNYCRRPRPVFQNGSCVVRTFYLDVWLCLEDWQIPLLNIGLIVPCVCIAYAVSRLATRPATDIPKDP